MREIPFNEWFAFTLGISVGLLLALFIVYTPRRFRAVLQTLLDAVCIFLAAAVIALALVMR